MLRVNDGLGGDLRMDGLHARLCENTRNPAHLQVGVAQANDLRSRPRLLGSSDVGTGGGCTAAQGVFVRSLCAAACPHAHEFCLCATLPSTSTQPWPPLCPAPPPHSSAPRWPCAPSAAPRRWPSEFPPADRPLHHRKVEGRPSASHVRLATVASAVNAGARRCPCRCTPRRAAVWHSSRRSAWGYPVWGAAGGARKRGRAC
jgi:hypothetical protein